MSGFDRELRVPGAGHARGGSLGAIMKKTNLRTINGMAAVASVALLLTGAAMAHDQELDGGVAEGRNLRNLQPFLNASGAVATYNVNGRFDSKSAFFQSLGTNGRSCATCHVASQGFSITPEGARQRFARTNGRDPLFAGVDGANCANGKRSDPAAHSQLLKHGLIRVAQAIPDNAQFQISVVHDPYGCALVADPNTGKMVASVYRRPLPSSNLGFLSTVMWDGRETSAPLNDGATFLANLEANLAHQVIDATLGHAEASQPPTQQQIDDIVKFEIGLYTAQVYDFGAGSLDRRGALGGPRILSEQIYYPGINDSLGGEPNGLPFSSSSMSSFSAWARPSTASLADNDDAPADIRSLGDYRSFAMRVLARYVRNQTTARRDIAAGEVLFNTAPLTITTVRGLNDHAGLGKPPAITGTCTTCHDSPNVGHHSLPLPLDIGVAHTDLSGLESDPNVAAGVAELKLPNLPVFQISGCDSPFNPGEPVSFYTTDPGKALISGQCSDVNRLKGPVLRGLAARAPYFHNGAAATLMQAVNFYNQRFQMNLTQEQKTQLVAFLNSL
jgi:cytochrome c peroxidase